MMFIRKIISLGVAMSFLMGNTGAAFAQSAQTGASPNTKEQMELVRQRLAETYNHLATLSDSEWTQAVQDSAAKMRKDGHTQQANSVESFADPDMKPILLKQLKEKLTEASQNGFFFWVCVFGSYTLCMTANPGVNMMVIMLWFFTFNDEGAVNY